MPGLRIAGTFLGTDVTEWPWAALPFPKRSLSGAAWGNEEEQDELIPFMAFRRVLRWSSWVFGSLVLQGELWRWGGCCATLCAGEVPKWVMEMVCNSVGKCGAWPHHL